MCMITTAFTSLDRRTSCPTYLPQLADPPVCSNKQNWDRRRWAFFANVVDLDTGRDGAQTPCVPLSMGACCAARALALLAHWGFIYPMVAPNQAV